MSNENICVVGLGYVGLPLAVEFNKYFPVTGFDINEKRIEQLKQNIDDSGETNSIELENCQIDFTSNQEKIKDSNFIIVCVPTPVDDTKRPDMSFLKSASEVIGNNLSKDSVVVYESTVYPGCTEEICLPILEKFSGLKCGEDFKIGYSPERINPGDKEHTIDKVIKIVSGIDSDSLERISFVYEKIAKAGVHKAQNIKTAEAAKVIENVQRDLNIALMNELAIIFDKIGIQTKDVLAAAGTKWNWHKYHPGLVGGHCIPVDPHYLTFKAEELGYNPEVILAGRRINDNMHKFVVEKLIKKLNNSGKVLKESKVLVLGLTFKADVKDHRNSRAKHLIKELKDYGISVIGCDPLLENELIKREFGVKNCKVDDLEVVDAVVFGSHHKQFNEIDWERLGNPVIINLKEI